MKQFTTLLPPLCEMLASTWDEKNYMCFLQPHSTPLINELTLCFQRWHSHPSQCCHCRPNTSIFTSPILHNSRIYRFQCSPSYRNQHPINQFLPLAIEVFGCLHKHVNVFLHDCVNANWSLKGPKGFHLSTLVTFLRQKVLITLQKM